MEHRRARACGERTCWFIHTFIEPPAPRPVPVLWAWAGHLEVTQKPPALRQAGCSDPQGASRMTVLGMLHQRF